MRAKNKAESVLKEIIKQSETNTDPEMEVAYDTWFNWLMRDIEYYENHS